MYCKFVENTQKLRNVKLLKFYIPKRVAQRKKYMKVVRHTHITEKMPSINDCNFIQ